MAIPKVIYQTHPNKTFTDAFHWMWENTLCFNSGYKHNIFDDSEMDDYINDTCSAELAAAYNRLSIPVAKSDVWRYAILYNEGGVYLDMDARLDVCLNDFLSPDDDAVISAGQDDWQDFTQFAIIFRKGHPILKRVLDYVVFNIKCFI